MKRTSALSEADLTTAFQQARVGEKFHIGNGSLVDSRERKRAYRCATCAGRKIATRKVKYGFHATVIQ